MKSAAGSPSPHRRPAAPIAVRVIRLAKDRAAAFDIRRRVFQDEQGVSAEEEFDADDDRAVHVLARVGPTAVGTARLLFDSGHAKVGRMAVLRAWRRRGVGRALLDTCVGIAGKRGVTQLVLHAQVHAIPFYTALGFSVAGEEFEEAGIPHRRMERHLIPKATGSHGLKVTRGK